MNNKYNRLIENGLRFIEKKQQKNGSFLSLSGRDKLFKDTLVYPTTFFSSVILSALKELNQSKALKIKRRIVKFLLAEKSSVQSFNYWQRKSKEYKSLR